MRADRLISILMLLQANGRLTASQLAEKLEVSERTILRDIDALGAAGVPVCSWHGKEGGFGLMPGYHSDLTGLTDSELRAVFLLSIPSSVADLGLDRALASALHKFAASIKDRSNPGARMRERYYLDPEPWRYYEQHFPHLSTLATAADNDWRARIVYRLPSGPTAAQCIDVYGLVAKEGAWHVVYLPESVAGGKRRPDKAEPAARFQALPLSALISAELVYEGFKRRQDFDLVKVWEAWCEAGERPPYGLWLLAAPDFAPQLAMHGLVCHIWEGAKPYRDGRVLIAAVAESFEDARAKVLALGAAVEVVAPEPLRRSVLDYAEQIRARYAAARRATLPARHPDLPPAETAIPQLESRSLELD